MEHNQEVYDREPEAYLDRALTPPERTLLRRFREHWPRIDMLDLGMGAGRTSYTFSALARSYVGVDYSPRLVELARELVGEDATTRFELGDARDLSRFGDASFDLVLFSFNGIDSVDHASRLRVLAEVRRVVRDDGWFCFSSHNLRALPWRRWIVKPTVRAPIASTREAASALRLSWQMARSNRAMDREKIERDGWAIVHDMGHGFKLDLYYVMPEVQLQQLRATGFELTAMYDQQGAELDMRSPGREAWIHYLCRPAVDERPVDGAAGAL